MGIVEPVNPKPPIGRFGEISGGARLHIVDRECGRLLCDHTILSLPGFPIGQRFDMMPYHERCVSVLVEMTTR